jgi:hypothetical protein
MPNAPSDIYNTTKVESVSRGHPERGASQVYGYAYLIALFDAKPRKIENLKEDLRLTDRL